MAETNNLLSNSDLIVFGEDFDNVAINSRECQEDFNNLALITDEELRIALTTQLDLVLSNSSQSPGQQQPVTTRLCFLLNELRLRNKKKSRSHFKLLNKLK